MRLIPDINSPTVLVWNNFDPSDANKAFIIANVKPFVFPCIKDSTIALKKNKFKNIFFNEKNSS